jgi:predicted XRE-type DNA-binding protein
MRLLQVLNAARVLLAVLAIAAVPVRNVFKDLGIPNAKEHLVKAQLVFKIDTIMKDRGLKQAEAADLLGVKQPDVSKMLRGDFRQFSVERLLRFLVALDHDVEIVVKPHRGKNDAAALHVC